MLRSKSMPPVKAVIGTAFCSVTLILILLLPHLSAVSKANQSPKAGHTPVVYWVGINASASNSFQLGSCIYLESRHAGMIEMEDKVKVYRIDDISKNVFDGNAPTDTAKFQLELVGKLQALSKETGTHSLRFWQDASKAPHQPATIIFFTDGFEEGAGPAEIRELQRVGTLLAADRNIRGVYLLGVDPRMKGLWTSVFHDMGSRFHMQGPITRSSIDMVEAAADSGN